MSLWIKKAGIKKNGALRWGSVPVIELIKIYKPKFDII